jgi:hypothetical protein
MIATTISSSISVKPFSLRISVLSLGQKKNCCPPGREFLFVGSLLSNGGASLDRGRPYRLSR